MTHEKTEPMKVGASLIARLIRDAYDQHAPGGRCPKESQARQKWQRAIRKAENAALIEAALCFGACDGDVSKLSPEWRERFLKLARYEAQLVGWSHTGFMYHEDPNAEYVPARDDHGSPGTVKAWRAPTTEEIKERIVDKWIAITGVAPDVHMLNAIEKIAELDPESWVRSEEIAAGLAVERGIGVEDVTTPINTEHKCVENGCAEPCATYEPEVKS